MFETHILIGKPFSVSRGCDFKSRGGWFDRVRKFFWHKWSQPHFDECTTYERIAIEHESIIPLITSALNALKKVPCDIECVLVGPKQCNIIYKDSSSFEFNSQIHFDNFGHHRVANVKIRVIPWFDGILVLPKDPC